MSNKKTHFWHGYNESVNHILQKPFGHNHSHRAHVSRLEPVTQIFVKILILSMAGLIIGAVTVRLNVFGGFADTKPPSFEKALSYMLILTSMYLALAILSLATKNLITKDKGRFTDLLVVLLPVAAITPLSLMYSSQIELLVTSLVVVTAALILAGHIFKTYSYSGLNLYLAISLLIIVGLLWGVNFFISMPAGLSTKILLLSSTPLILVSLPSGFLGLLELYDVLCKDHWRKIKHPYPKQLHSRSPFVSLQVPTYSEPPEIVIKTLEALNKIDYQNYEVIVIDNNTKDQDLWKPVSEYCQQIGPRFKFFHIDNLPGAKAGALNYINDAINPKAEVIGVIDADYEADSNFLKELVGYFEDPKLGFIQTPHDYREWRNNMFLTMCYWEYRIFFHSTMISLNERDSGITVGTMCLLRKEAFDKAGGWSEWCVTEDSELAIRIHDQGYSSIYIDKTYGRGLIPDSFEGYKKQRYRWTAGPVQEFRHYYKHFLGFSKRSSNFSFVQRVFHLNHGLANTLTAFNIPLMVIGLATIVSMIINNEVILVPIELWVAATITVIAKPLLTILLYQITVKATLKQIAEQALATKALSHVVAHASLRTALTGQAKWTRTSKFRSDQSYLAALYSTKEEITIGLLLITFASVSYALFPYAGLSTMLLIGVIYLAIGYFAAPLMATIGVWSLKRRSS